MGEILSVLLLAAVITGVLVLGWWLLIASEGVYLGRRVVIWLYDLYAHRYDDVKNYQREYEQLFLGKPIMSQIYPENAPLVLDVATGTGRIPLALAQHDLFEGYTVGVDLSRKMLHYAARNIYPYNQRAVFIHAPAEHLPFPDDLFDVVTCLEALEFMIDPRAVLVELVRVLRPGGLLLITQRVNTRWMPGKTWTSGQTITLLTEAGIENARAQVWQVDYRKVWGRKRGEGRVTRAKPLDEILRCPRCGQIGMKPAGGRWRCENCKAEASVGQDGVIELFPLYH